jgi:hypothetical protein
MGAMRRLLAVALLLPDFGHAKGPEAGYAVVAFGAKEQRRVALAADEGVLFVDRNGNGSAKDPGERIERDDRGDFVTDVTGCDEEGREGTIRLRATLATGADGRLGIKCLSVHPVEDIQAFHSTAGFIPFAAKPEDAPTIPIDGPLRFVLMDHWTGETKCRVLPRAGGEHELSILVAAPVRGIEGEAYVYPNLYRLEGEALPTIRVEFERADGKGVAEPALKVRECDCGRRYRCKLAVPPAEQTVRATLFLSFPGWRHGKLEDAKFDLRYADAPAQ